jgi:hypothetical protein
LFGNFNIAKLQKLGLLELDELWLIGEVSTLEYNRLSKVLCLPG